MPNLENLKKQAKQYLRWHRDGYYPVAAQIRSVLPRYRHLTDQQVMASSFKLSDAQELVARKLAFESWEALRKIEVAGGADIGDEELRLSSEKNGPIELFGVCASH